MSTREKETSKPEALPELEPLEGEIVGSGSRLPITLDRLPQLGLPPDVAFQISFLVRIRYRGLAAALRAIADAQDAAADLGEKAERFIHALMNYERTRRRYEQLPEILATDTRNLKRELLLREMKKQAEIEDFFRDRAEKRRGQVPLAGTAESETAVRSQNLKAYLSNVAEVRKTAEETRKAFESAGVLTENDLEDFDDLTEKAIRHLKTVFQPSAI